MTREEIRDGYFEWLVSKVCYPGHVNYRKLLKSLHEIPFRWTLKDDENRSKDGVDLRTTYRYSIDVEDPDCYKEPLEGNCSLLEMMVALAIKCENTIMGDPEIGDRTSIWFWKMVGSMGLGELSDEKFDPNEVIFRTENLMNRRFCRDGFGSLFMIPGCSQDLRKMGIWYQMNLWLNTL